MEKNIPDKFKSLLVGKDLKESYLCALNADRRSNLEKEFIKWVDDNNLLEF